MGWDVSKVRSFKQNKLSNADRNRMLGFQLWGQPLIEELEKLAQITDRKVLRRQLQHYGLIGSGQQSDAVYNEIRDSMNPESDYSLIHASGRTNNLKFRKK